MLPNFFQAIAHFENFPVAEGRIARLLQLNPARRPVALNFKSKF